MGIFDYYYKKQTIKSLELSCFDKFYNEFQKNNPDIYMRREYGEKICKYYVYVKDENDKRYMFFYKSYVGAVAMMEEIKKKHNLKFCQIAVASGFPVVCGDFYYTRYSFSFIDVVID